MVKVYTQLCDNNNNCATSTPTEPQPNPNTPTEPQLQKWIVNGVTRIGIFATEDISAGTSLSYDYQFSTNEHSRFRCKCGAPKCRGSLSSQGYREVSSSRVGGIIWFVFIDFT